MTADELRMIRILYSPADYAHPDHLQKMLRQPELRDSTLMSFWLLRTGGLCDLPMGWRCEDTLLSRLLTHWYQFPTIAHLAGGYLLRHQLPIQGAALMSDPRLLAFISLPLHHQVIMDTTKGGEDAASCGSAFIFGQFPEMPLALRQRLLLQFPADMEPAQLIAPKTVNNINLLQMALSYAHHYY